VGENPVQCAGRELLCNYVRLTKTKMATSTKKAPDCPVCYEALIPPKKIFQCSQGHFLCEKCKMNPNLKWCPTCRQAITGRNIGMELTLQMLLDETPNVPVPLTKKPTARLNNAFRASFADEDLDSPFAQGAFRWVAKGVYDKGMRKGEPCVAKWFKTGISFEEKYFATDLFTVNKAIEIIEKWNNSRLISQHVMVNKAEVWEFLGYSGKWSGSKVLQEPFIENYTKFNSNTGWNTQKLPWARVMQAISHFSYHVSNGQFVLCDLQGGQTSSGVVLSDPVILSNSKLYGPTDLGSLGISSFFSRHQCNEFCKSFWRKPGYTYPYFAEMEGTSMLD